MAGADELAVIPSGRCTATLRSSGRHAVRIACTRPTWRSSCGETGRSLWSGSPSSIAGTSRAGRIVGARLYRPGQRAGEPEIQVEAFTVPALYPADQAGRAPACLDENLVEAHDAPETG